MAIVEDLLFTLTWCSPEESMPEPKERVIILLRNGSRHQFATFNKQNGTFINAGGTQFYPHQVKFWLSVKALPALPYTEEPGD